MIKDTDIDLDFLHACFSLDRAGRLRWKRRPPGHFASAEVRKAWNGRYAGKRAGSKDNRGALRVGMTIEGKLRFVKVRRAAYALQHGRWPDGRLPRPKRTPGPKTRSPGASMLAENLAKNRLSRFSVYAAVCLSALRSLSGTLQTAVRWVEKACRRPALG
jgi:hypothetical protein